MTDWRHGKDAQYRPGDVVYLLRDNQTGLLKIGASQRLHERFRDLKRMYGDGLEALYFVHGYKPLETRLHQRFQVHKFIKNTRDKRNAFNDWYHAAPEIYLWFARYGTPIQLVSTSKTDWQPVFYDAIEVYRQWAADIARPGGDEEDA